MPKRTKKSGGGKGVVAVLLLTVLGAGVLAGYVKLSPQAAHVSIDNQHFDRGTTLPHIVPSESQPVESATTDALLVPSVIQNDVKLDKPVGPLPEGIRPEVHLINETLISLKIEGAKALGVDVSDHLAKVSFNAGIEKGYGTVEEGYLIKALQMALGQFKDIDKFQLIVEGRVVDSLGNIDLSTPQDVIRPGQPAATSDSAKPIDPD